MFNLLFALAAVVAASLHLAASRAGRSNSVAVAAT